MALKLAYFQPVVLAIEFNVRLLPKEEVVQEILNGKS